MNYSVILKSIISVWLIVSLVSCGQTGTQHNESNNVQVPSSKMTMKERTLKIAEQEYASSCMKKKGFKFIPYYPPKKVAKDDSIRGDNIEFRHRKGYQISEKSGESVGGATKPNADYINSLSPQQKRAYTVALSGHPKSEVTVKLPTGDKIGTNTTGCFAQAEKYLYGDLKKWMRVEMIEANVKAFALRRVRKDPEFVQARKDWSRCMRRKGYHYDTPSDAVKAVSKMYEKGSADSATLRKREKVIAVADARCNRKVGLADTKRKLLKKYEKKVSEEQQGALLTYREMREQALDRAEKIIERLGGGPRG